MQPLILLAKACVEIALSAGGGLAHALSNYLKYSLHDSLL